MTRFLYLHGFASGPQSGKAQFFRKRFKEKGIDLEIPILDGGDFRNLTVTGQLEILEAEIGDDPCVFIGSSLGGYLAALYAARHTSVEKLVLLAPAFRFPSRWREMHSPKELALWKQNGFVSVYHYGEQRDMALGYQLMEDSAKYVDEPDFEQPALVLHGNADTVVPYAVSTAFASRHPNVTVRLFDAGHDLMNVLEDLWDDTERFLGLRPGARQFEERVFSSGQPSKPMIKSNQG